MKLQVAILMFIVSASAQAGDGTPATGQTSDEAKGPSRIVRTAEWPDFIGGTVSVEQSLIRNSKGQYVYRYDDQSEATKQYHEASCTDIGMNPAKGESITVGPGSAAWHCSNIESNSVGETKSTDYVIAYAPNGQVSAGQNFVSYGTVRFNSSVGGNIQGSAQIDNRVPDLLQRVLPTKYRGKPHRESTLLRSCSADHEYVDGRLRTTCLRKRSRFHQGRLTSTSFEVAVRVTRSPLLLA